MIHTISIKEKHFFSFPSAINHIIAEGKYKKKNQLKKIPTTLEQSC